MPDRFRGSKAQPIALVNGQIALPDRVLDEGVVTVENGKIAAICTLDELADHIVRVDVGGRLISPGLVDIHIHGATGHSFNEASESAFAAITQANGEAGVTSLLATTATDSIEKLVECLACARRWMASPRAGAQLLGVHVEGPYFALSQAGAQDPAHLRRPDDGTPARLLAFHDVIKILTFAPELPGAVALTRDLVRLGIVPAAGHSNATEEEIAPCLEAGLSHFIHIWSGQSSTVREGPWRKPGLLEVTLTADNISAEMISDGKHLPATLMKLAYKCLGPDRLCAISDATSGAGLSQGARFRMGGMEYEVHDGVGMLLDRSAFAGSTTLLNAMLPILTQVANIPLAEAIRMASLTPARVIGVADRKGSLAPGKDADIAIFDADFRTWRVMIGGEWVRGKLQ
ncbi:MAG: N-acetylglucosamine-6-phosphate deacetylase [Caldilineaceae bacterium]|nr:N-acetylglucosamine-6-phosphate deacetylase [Caldilineaceae bacterium]